MTAPRPPTVILVTLLIFGAALRLWGIGFGLPHPMTRPDEEFIVSVALRFFSGDFNPHFFEWPSLYFYVVHLVFRAIYAIGQAAGVYPDTAAFIAAASDPTTLHLTLRLMSATSGVLTLLVVWKLVRTVFDEATALCATAFLAFSYLHVRDSHFGVLDVPLTLLITTTIWLLVCAWRRPTALVLWASAGFCAGLATSVKYNAAAVLVSAAVTFGLSFAAGPADNRRRLLTALGLFGATCALAFFAGSPYILLDFAAFREGLAAQVVRLTKGHGVSIDQVWLRHLTFSLWYGLGPLVLASAVAGAVLMGIRQPRTAGVLLSFPASYLLVIGTGHTAFIRYATPLVPFFCIAAGYAVREIVETAAVALRPRARAAILAGVVTLCLLPSLVTVVRFNRVLTQTDTRLIAADWMSRNFKNGDSFYESGASYARPHYALPAHVLKVEALEFEPVKNAFSKPDGTPASPDWIVISESPLRLYTRVPPELRSIVNSGYELAFTVSGTTRLEPEAAYDRQDAFFLPYADFSARIRPGPQISIYRKTERPYFNR